MNEPIKRKRCKVYISGRMSGLTREEYMRNFRVAEEEMRRLGYKHIVNPVRVWACRWPWLYRIVGYRLTLLYDLWLLMRCDYIYKLPGWNGSRGAKIESSVAIQMQVYPIPKEDIDKLNQKLHVADGRRHE